MTERKRTAQQIREYIEKFDATRRMGKSGWRRQGAANFTVCARTDLPLVLDKMERYRDAAVRAETAWLADENGEESET